jgi:hypothetical protein
MPTLASLLTCCACLACLAAPAATTVTVHNQTGRTLAVTRLWSPWRPEPDDPPMAMPFFQRRIRPGAVATYRFQLTGKDLDSELVIRQLPPDALMSAVVCRPVLVRPAAAV